MGRHFAAITDPGSGLHELARSLGFRRIFLNDPEIGGRYSSLSLFGIVPARLAGADPDRLLAGGLGAREEIVDDGPGLRLGAALGAGEAAGRDKLTLVASPSLESLGAWIEQLVAESTGKEGKGILPVHGEPPGEPGSYADDRLFAYLKLAGEDDSDTFVRDLAAAGHPVVRIELDHAHDVGAAMYLWKVATIVAAHLMAINPFDQPNVEASKVLARSILDEYRSRGVLRESPPPSSRTAWTPSGPSKEADWPRSSALSSHDGRGAVAASVPGFPCLPAARSRGGGSIDADPPQGPRPDATGYHRRVRTPVPALHRAAAQGGRGTWTVRADHSRGSPRSADPR